MFLLFNSFNKLDLPAYENFEKLKIEIHHQYKLYKKFKIVSYEYV